MVSLVAATSDWSCSHSRFSHLLPSCFLMASTNGTSVYYSLFFLPASFLVMPAGSKKTATISHCTEISLKRERTGLLLERSVSSQRWEVQHLPFLGSRQHLPLLSLAGFSPYIAVPVGIWDYRYLLISSKMEFLLLPSNCFWVFSTRRIGQFNLWSTIFKPDVFWEILEASYRYLLLGPFCGLD